jgi:hypothetical protein
VFCGGEFDIDLLSTRYVDIPFKDSSGNLVVKKSHPTEIGICQDCVDLERQAALVAGAAAYKDRAV